MKGLMVTLLMMCAANFACAQSADNDDGGKFVLRLTDTLIEDLKKNPGGLSAMIRPQDRGKISEVLILYTPPRNPVTQTQPPKQQVVARQDFSTRPSLKTTAPPISTGTNSGLGTRPGFVFGNGNLSAGSENRRTGNSNLNNGNNNLGTGSDTRSATNDQNPFNTRTAMAGSSEPIPGQDWLPVGDYTDFVPVTRKENWIREIPSGVSPAFRPRNDSVARNPNNNQALPQQNQWERFPNTNLNTPKTDQFSGMDQMANERIQREQEQMRLSQLDQEYKLRMQQYEQQLAEQQRQFNLRQQQLEQQELDYQRNLNTQRLASNNLVGFPPANAQSYSGLDNYMQRNPQPNSTDNDIVRRLMDRNEELEKKLTRVEQNESGFYSDRLAMNEDRALNNPSIPGRRFGNSVASNQRPTGLNDVQIPGPNQSNRDGNAGRTGAGTSSTFRGSHAELVANLSSLKKTNGFLLFMLLCSVGINVYLGLISRNFYTRYAELADELRETFTATM